MTTATPTHDTGIEIEASFLAKLHRVTSNGSGRTEIGKKGQKISLRVENTTSGYTATAIIPKCPTESEHSQYQFMIRGSKIVGVNVVKADNKHAFPAATGRPEHATEAHKKVLTDILAQV